MQAKGILSHVKDLICNNQNCFLVPLISVLTTAWEMSKIFILHASSSRNCDIGQPYSSQTSIKKEALLIFPFARATPTSSQAILQLVMQLEREDANTSYLTSSRQSQPSPPSLFLPEVHQAAAAHSVVVSSSHKPTLSPSTTPRNTAPTSAAHTKYPTGFANHFSSRDVLANKKWGIKKSWKVAVRDIPA